MSKYMIIDGNRVDFDNEKNILQDGLHGPDDRYGSDG